jgi:hypothetical protein
VIRIRYERNTAMFRPALRILLLLVSVLALALYASSSMRGIVRRTTIDPFEKAVLASAARFAHGQVMYAEPRTEAEPSLMPGYAIAIAALTGEAPKLAHVRAFTLVATLLAAILVALIVQLECGSWTLALAGGSFALLAQAMLGAPPSLARPQPVMMTLVLLGYLTIRHLPSVWGAVLGAVPLAAAVFVDPMAAWFAAGAAFSLAREPNRGGPAFTLTAGVLIGAAYLALSRFEGPWFNFNAWDAPLATIRFGAEGVVRFLGDHLLRTLGVWTIAAVISFALTTEPWLGRGGMWMCLAGSALLGGAWSTQSRAFGGAELLPSILALSIVGPLMLQRVARHLAAWQDPDRPGGENVVYVAALLQFIAVFAAAPVDRWAPAVTRLFPGL